MKLFSNIGFYIGLLIGASVATVGFYVMSENNDKETAKTEAELKDSNQAPTKENRPDQKEVLVVNVDDYSEDVPEKVPMQTIITVSDSMEIDSVHVQLDTLSSRVDSVKAIEDEPILVRKDVLMRTLNFKLSLEDSLQKDVIDTLAADLNIVESVAHDHYTLELWESPIGYSGYKTSGNKIMVFGIDTAKFIDLRQTENGLNLHVGKEVYLIEQKSEFVDLQKRPSK